MKKLVIKPYRQSMGLDAARAQQIWQSLREAIEEIFSHNASQLSFEELYRNSYNLVLHKHGDLLYNGVMEVLTEKLETMAESVAQVTNDSDLLVQINQQWSDHQVVMTMVRDVLMYMDRTFVKQKRKTPVYDAGLIAFRELVVRHAQVRERMRLLLLKQIENERHGELMDRDLMKNVLRMLVEIGIQSNEVYEEDFEFFFLDQTLEFYRAEAQYLLDHSTVAEYLARAERRLQEEGDRVRFYLHASTEHRLKTIVETQLIKEHAKQLVENEQSGFAVMVRDRKLDDLRRMYLLFRRVPSTLDEMGASLFALIEKMGMELLGSQCLADKATDPSLFIDKLLLLRSQMMELCTKSFLDDAFFQKTIKQAFEKFMNINTTCASGLAFYLDELLRGKLKLEEHSMDVKVNDLIGLFRLLQDKDVFEEFYKVLLAKRLLSSSKSASSGAAAASATSGMMSSFSNFSEEEAEKMVISKLKAECGYQFTSKLEGMFKDLNLSRDLMEQYRSSPSNNCSVQLSVQVLTSGYWPINQSDFMKGKLPQELRELQQHFEQFYFSRHNGRTLCWMMDMGNADVRCVFYNQREDEASKQTVSVAQRHDLNVSSIQASILMLFNSRREWSLSQMLQALQLDEQQDYAVQEFKRHLISLCAPKYKILLKSSKGKRMTLQDVFEVNENYKSKLHRVRVALVSQKETVNLGNAEAVSDGAVAARPFGISSSHPFLHAHAAALIGSTASNQVPPTVAEDRKHLVEASIVRIMKTRKTMQHNNLIAEVTRQMSGRFTPAPQLIKLRIESLIEREYLQRSTQDRRTYHYLA